MQHEKLISALQSRGFEATYCETTDNAKKIILEEVQKAKTVSWGGSETLNSLEIKETIRSLRPTFDHAEPADLFILSANALLQDGRIINIDGTGNRVSQSIYGPKTVLYIIGTNKIVDGTLEDGIKRAKDLAAIPNCLRLHKNTPCALTGKCEDCDSPDRICKVTVIFDRAPTRTRTFILLINTPLGY